MKALTVQEVIDRMQELVRAGKVKPEDWVMIEGCDCNGYVDGVEIEAEFKFVPRLPEYTDDGEFLTEHVSPGPVIRLKRMGRK